MQLLVKFLSSYPLFSFIEAGHIKLIIPKIILISGENSVSLCFSWSRIGSDNEKRIMLMILLLRQTKQISFRSMTAGIPR